MPERAVERPTARAPGSLMAWIDDAGFQPLGTFLRFVPGALPQAGMEGAVGAEAMRGICRK